VTFFCVLRQPGNLNFSVQKLDINLWILPGIIGRRVMFCDVGVKLIIESPSTANPEPLQFSLGIPLATEGTLSDLVPKFYTDRELANLVFGNTATAPVIVNHRYHYNDGDSDMMLAPVKNSDCKVQHGDKRSPYSLWDIAVKHPVVNGETIYVRLRFRVHRSGRVWYWQRLGIRRSYVITDIRINELRDKPRLAALPDFVNESKEIQKAHVFLIVSSRLKTARVSPAASYVRLLEDRLWEPYLERRLGRKGDIFTITHWRKATVNAQAPLRAFVEHERRRPPAGRVALITLVAVIGAFILLLPSSQLHHSILGSLRIRLDAIYGILSLGGIIMVLRISDTYIPRVNRAVFKFVRWIEDWRYRPQ